MSSSVVVRVPARLHLGFLDPSGAAARRFGSIGLPVTDPETVISIRRAPQTVVDGIDHARASRHLAAMCAALDIRANHQLTVERAIPAHVGLGSGTQIALAVAAGLRRLHGLPLDVDKDATRLSRGGRSGIGIASFEQGGVIVDAGGDDSGAPPPVIARMPFPDNWRVLLVLDHRMEGLHGAAEVEAFRSLPPFPREGVGEISKLVLLAILPALAQRNFADFGMALSTLQRIVGMHFAPAQGGIFTSRRVAEVVAQLQAAGASGVGQSSWGPTGFAFAPSEKAARDMVASVGRHDDIEIRIVRGRNEGASLEMNGFKFVAN